MIKVDFEKVIETVKKTKAIVNDKELKSNISMKGKADFVTEVDLRISSFLGEELKKITPDIGFMSEEEENIIVPTRWILDPIDGTTNLVYNYNMCSVSLALCVEEVIEFGVVYNPFNDDLFVAYRGRGAYYNGEKMGKIEDRELEDCLVEFGAGSTKKHQADVVFEIAKEIFKNCLDLRRICSSALSICYIAQGRINGYFEKELKPWDFAAASLVLEECGGKISSWDSDSIGYKSPTSCVCGSSKAYVFIKETVNRFTLES